jgi:hypothetical protein
MAEWWPFDRSWADEWKRNLTEVLNLSSAAAQSLGLPGTLPGDPFAALVAAARSWLIGKKRTLSFAGADLTLVLTDISVPGTDLARALGQYGQVSISAREVQWGGYELERMDVRARNVHLRPGAPPTIVIAPLLIEAFVSAAAASRWLAAVSPQLELTLRAGVPQVGLTGVPWARLEVEAGAGGQSVLIRPRALHLGDWRVSLPAPAFQVPLPGLPSGLMLTSVEPAPGGFTVRAMLSEWQRSLSADDIGRLLAAMRAGQDRLDL